MATVSSAEIGSDFHPRVFSLVTDGLSHAFAVGEVVAGRCGWTD
jgi:hypothetical protein